MAVFVTGASGFLGGRLTQVLQERGEDVIILARGHSDLSHLAGLPFRIVRGALNDRAVLQSALKDATRIFHCAACSTDWAAHNTYFETNVTGTKNLLEAARAAPRLERFVHVSTTDVYGYPELPCAEDNAIVDAGLPYNQSKGLAELEVWDAYKRFGFPVTVIRPATIFGPRGKDFTEEVGLMLRQRLMATIDGGSAPGGFTYVDNVVDALLLAAASQKAVGQAYNISDGTGTTWQQYLALYAGRLGTSKPWIDFSLRQALGLAGVFEAVHRSLKLGGRPLLTRHAVYLLGRNQEFSIQKAIGELRFWPKISMEEGVDRSAGWFLTSHR